MKTDLDKLRVALVYDRVNKWGGAERVLLALKKIFPQAPLFTSVYLPKSASWAKNWPVKPSFGQRFPLVKKRHEFFPWLMPFIFESFDFRGYQLVISVTSAEAKGIITPPETCHLCYCLTPTRYLWSGRRVYFDSPGFGWLDGIAKKAYRFFLPFLLRWDKVAAQRPDSYLAISGEVRQRIKKNYRRDAEIIYPPVDLDKFKIKDDKFKTRKKNYFLVVSRLVPYKRIDLVIEAFNQLDRPLKIAGIGSQMSFLKKMAGPKIEFLGQLTEKALLSYYNSCRAVICPQEEDFGLVPLEAQACGKPVISYQGGGALETVVKNRTGEFFYPQTADALARTVLGFNVGRYCPDDCRRNAQRFSQKLFIRKFTKKTEEIWKKFSQEN
ncbi:MAG: glycosyltransferase [Candidatus Pacebacteria bacterium]|nr:glycosyltransferase [Candidatus Paceibacterota bacterium]